MTQVESKLASPRRSAVSQVHAYVSRDQKATFDAYADALCLDASSLLKILIRRELSRRCLTQAVSPKSPGKEKITAHFSSKSPVQARIFSDFSAYAEGIGQTRTSVASSLALQELSENWLRQALS